jgi:hypothetical protein
VIGDRQFVVGSRTRVLRLYCPRSLKKAVAKLPTIGLEISHVDVTFDGKLVLATTAQMLVLFSLHSSEGDTSFRKGLGKKVSLPINLCLTIDDENLTYGSKFVAGRFDLVRRSQFYCYHSSLQSFNVL